MTLLLVIPAQAGIQGFGSGCAGSRESDDGEEGRKEDQDRTGDKDSGVLRTTERAG